MKFLSLTTCISMLIFFRRLFSETMDVLLYFSWAFFYCEFKFGGYHRGDYFRLGSLISYGLLYVVFTVAAARSPGMLFMGLRISVENSSRVRSRIRVLLRCMFLPLMFVPSSKIYEGQTYNDLVVGCTVEESKIGLVNLFMK